MKKIIYVWIFALACGVVVNGWCSQILNDLENNIIRLHIIANSDDAHDQEIKLMVRDSIIELAHKEGELPDINKLEVEVNKVLRRENAPYNAKVSFGKYPITRRSYENFILPQGVYTAARVELGNAEGKNWWCVLSPPLCFTQSAFGESDELAEHLGEQAGKAVMEDKITVKLKILEIGAAIRRHFAG